MPIVTSDQGGLVTMRRDRRRRIDGVIDYFGESRETRATRARPALSPAGACTVRPGRTESDEVEQIRTRGGRRRGSSKGGRRGRHSGLVI